MTGHLLAADCARAARIAARTWRAYAHRGQAPPPNGSLGRTPWWTEARLAAWLDYGPGRTGVDWAAWARKNPDT